MKAFKREFLERRNALWAALRQLSPTDPRTEHLLQELEAMIGWSREKVLAGLGWDFDLDARPK
jgi:hypothetical protein